MAKQKSTNSPSKKSEKKQSKYLIDQIPDNDKWGALQASEVLKQIEAQQRQYFVPSVFFSLILCAFYILLESMVHFQFSEERTWTEMATVCLYNVFPFLLILVYITNRYVENNIIQYGMTLVGIWCGIRMFQYSLLQQSNYGELLRTPGIATVWIYLIAQLRLTLAIFSFAVIGLFFLYLHFWG